MSTHTATIPAANNAAASSGGEYLPQIAPRLNALPPAMYWHSGVSKNANAAHAITEKEKSFELDRPWSLEGMGEALAQQWDTNGIK